MQTIGGDQQPVRDTVESFLPNTPDSTFLVNTRSTSFGSQEDSFNRSHERLHRDPYSYPPPPPPVTLTRHNEPDKKDVRYVTSVSSAVEKRLTARGLAVPNRRQVVQRHFAFKRTPSRREGGSNRNLSPVKRRGSLGGSIMASAEAMILESPPASPRARLSRRASTGGCAPRDLLLLLEDASPSPPLVKSRTSMGRVTEKANHPVEPSSPRSRLSRRRFSTGGAAGIGASMPATNNNSHNNIHNDVVATGHHTISEMPVSRRKDAVSAAESTSKRTSPMKARHSYNKEEGANNKTSSSRCRRNRCLGMAHEHIDDTPSSSSSSRRSRSLRVEQEGECWPLPKQRVGRQQQRLFGQSDSQLNYIHHDYDRHVHQEDTIVATTATCDSVKPKKKSSSSRKQQLPRSPRTNSDQKVELLMNQSPTEKGKKKRKQRQRHSRHERAHSSDSQPRQLPLDEHSGDEASLRRRGRHSSLASYINVHNDKVVTASPKKRHNNNGIDDPATLPKRGRRRSTSVPRRFSSSYPHDDATPCTSPRKDNHNDHSKGGGTPPATPSRRSRRSSSLPRRRSTSVPRSISCLV